MTSDHREDDDITQKSEKDKKNDDRMPNFSTSEAREVQKTDENGTGGLSEKNVNICSETTSCYTITTTEDVDKQCDSGSMNSLHDENNENIEESTSTMRPHLVEIKHLKRRIKNVQEISIQTSRDAIASDLAKYQNNVLNATENCVNEWRAIARYYEIISDGENDDEGISSDKRTEVGLAVFLLIQLSVQSGPLSGGKPGYFKRCGAEVAKVVLEFLEEVVPKHEELGIDCMGFTSNQMNTMNKWIVNAKKAVENDKPPSRTALKKMKQLQHKVEKQNIQKRNKMKRKEKKLAKSS